MSKMPSYKDVLRRSEDKPAFSNGTEFEAWSAGWCERPGAPCVNDEIQRGVGDKVCPLLDVAMLENRTPDEWADRASTLGPGMYRCTRYQASSDTAPYPTSEVP